MPLSDDGGKIRAHMREQYGKKRGYQVFYAKENKDKKFKKLVTGKSEFRDWWVARILEMPELLQDLLTDEVDDAFPDIKIRKALRKAKTADYKPGRKIKRSVDFQGLPIAIEYNKGDYREWKNQEDGKPGVTLMKEAYGYIKGTEGEDDMGIDCFLGPNKEAREAFIIRQDRESGKYDEDKVMLGFNTEKEAKTCYKEHYNNDMFGEIEAISMKDLVQELKRNQKHPGALKSFIVARFKD